MTMHLHDQTLCYLIKNKPLCKNQLVNFFSNWIILMYKTKLLWYTIKTILRIEQTFLWVRRPVNRVSIQ